MIRKGKFAELPLITIALTLVVCFDAGAAPCFSAGLPRDNH